MEIIQHRTGDAKLIHYFPVSNPLCRRTEKKEYPQEPPVDLHHYHDPRYPQISRLRGSGFTSDRDKSSPL